MPITPRSVRAGLLALLASAAGALATTQPTSGSPLAPPPNGPRSAPSSRHVLTNATIHVSPTQTIERGVVVIEGDTIASVLSQDEYDSRLGRPHPNTRDLDGAHVYAGFIDLWTPVDAPTPETDTPGAHWATRITPQRSALDGKGLPAGEASRLRKLGFGAAAIAPRGGIMRGDAAIVSTAQPMNDPSEGTPPIHSTDAFSVIGFERNGWGSRGYPTSHMGIVSLVRQAFLDAAYTRTHENDAGSAMYAVPEPSDRIAWNTSSALESMLAAKIASEFELSNMLIVGAGDEQHRLAALAEAGHALVVPLRFPAKPDVTSVAKADDVSLDDLVAWEQAPANIARLLDEDLTVAITSSKLPNGAKFFDNLRRAHTEGRLSPERALAALTTTPAQLAGLAGTLGTVEAGKHANLVVFTDDMLTDDAEIRDVWVDGRRHEIDPGRNDELDGDWRLYVGSPDEPFFEMTFSVDGNKITLEEAFDENPDANPDDGEQEEPATGKARAVSIDPPMLSFLIDDHDDSPSNQAGTYVVTGALQADGTIRGSGLAPDQSTFAWTATRIEKEPEASADDAERADASDDEDAGDIHEIPPHPGYPFGSYAVQAQDEPRITILTNATVWTQGPDGIIENAWVMLRDGKVSQLGTGGYPRIAADVIDCEGLHITPGLIDAHSHTGLFRLGVNESGQAVTAECRIGDSLDPGHINWYRQLAGGVTTANLLHGSANPIGGQSQTVKVRWGAHTPEGMFFDGAKPGIKFALGENVKQSNWGDDYTTRYPQTRMGVETLIRDRFTAAREYLDNGRKTASGRTDLELEALAEILAGERLIHCHSYRQDEILMLCRVAEDFGFKIGTFQHGLETYKVAEIVKEHAIGASIFSDWWAYKVEVQDAIPYAGPINHEAGLLTSFNSDSDELARRMNLEAAKALKYARESGIEMTPEQALAFVTINPAIQLGIDSRVGSLEPGKDADLVVWSGDPLSTFSRPERVFIDGREVFSLDRDAQMRERIRAERQRIISYLIAAPDRGEDKAKDRNKSDDASESAEDAGPEEEPDHRTSGHAGHDHEDLVDPNFIDPNQGLPPGDCGCYLVAPAHQEIE